MTVPSYFLGGCVKSGRVRRLIVALYASVWPCVYTDRMAKRRVNLYLDGEVYDRVKEMCNRMGRAVTPSTIANESLVMFDTHLTPIFEKALSGDRDAAFQLLQSFGFDALGTLSKTMGDVHTEHAKTTVKGRAT